MDFLFSFILFSLLSCFISEVARYVERISSMDGVYGKIWNGPLNYVFGFSDV
jgi:hypothetical protein